MKKMLVLLVAAPAGWSRARSGEGWRARALVWARLQGLSARLSGQQPLFSAAGRGEGVTINPSPSPKFLLGFHPRPLSLLVTHVRWPESVMPKGGGNTAQRRVLVRVFGSLFYFASAPAPPPPLLSGISPSYSGKLFWPFRAGGCDHSKTNSKPLALACDDKHQARRRSTSVSRPSPIAQLSGEGGQALEKRHTRAQIFLHNDHLFRKNSRLQKRWPLALP